MRPVFTRQPESCTSPTGLYDAGLLSTHRLPGTTPGALYALSQPLLPLLCEAQTTARFSEEKTEAPKLDAVPEELLPTSFLTGLLPSPLGERLSRLLGSFPLKCMPLLDAPWSGSASVPRNGGLQVPPPSPLHRKDRDERTVGDRASGLADTLFKLPRLCTRKCWRTRTCTHTLCPLPGMPFPVPMPGHQPFFTLTQRQWVMLPTVHAAEGSSPGPP